MDMMKPLLITVTILLTVCLSQVFALSDTDFQEIGNKYGVSPYLLQAISIVESQNGTLTGKYQVSEVVDQTQLKYLRKIARHTGRPLSGFYGSHAGAMGYMQFIPSTFYKFAQDGDGDGVKDPLNDHDSLATAAYYLATKLSKTKSKVVTLRHYNNSRMYGRKVLSLYRQLEANSKLVSRQ